MTREKFHDMHHDRDGDDDGSERWITSRNDDYGNGGYAKESIY